jgi:hypothetical protein
MCGKEKRDASHDSALMPVKFDNHYVSCTQVL